MKFRILAMVVATSSVLVGCGGGSSGGPALAVDPFGGSTATPVISSVPVVSNPQIPVVTVQVPTQPTQPTQTPVSTVTPAPGQPEWGTLENLIGRVTFEHVNFGAQQVYTDAVVFSDSTEIVVRDGLRTMTEVANGIAYGCIQTDAEIDFLCLRTDGTGTEVFLFNMESAIAGSGLFELCDTDDFSVCLDKLVTNPDGVVAVIVNKFNTKVQSGVIVDGRVIPLTTREARDLNLADQAQFAGSAPAISVALDGSDLSRLQNVVAQQLEQLNKR